MGAEERHRFRFRLEYGVNRIAAAFADNNHHFALADLIAEQSSVAAVFFQVSGLVRALGRHP
jgi:hypothetical protein